MYDYFLVLETEAQWLELAAELDCVENLSIDVIGTIYETFGEELVAIEGFHVNLRTQHQHACLEALIGDFCIDPPVTPYRVWA